MKYPAIQTLKWLRAVLLLATTLGMLTPSLAQTAASDKTTTSAPEETASTNDYQIGPGDILAITVSDAPEFTGKFRVNQSGYLELSSLSTPLQAKGKTPLQLSSDLTRVLEDAKLYRNPAINIFVDEYHSKNVTVVGAVNKPSIYPLQRRTTLLEVISQAGGLGPTAGNKITIVSGGTHDPNEKGSSSSARTIELSKLVHGEDTSLNVEVHDGDVVNVSSAEVIYVVGAVVKPGGYVLPDQTSRMTVLQALAMSQGPSPVANTHRSLIIRRSADGTARENLPVDMVALMSGKIPDVALEANDILYIPASGTKQTFRTMGQVAMTVVNGVAFYGVGARVGNL